MSGLWNHSLRIREESPLHLLDQAFLRFSAGLCLYGLVNQERRNRKGPIFYCPCLERSNQGHHKSSWQSHYMSQLRSRLIAAFSSGLLSFLQHWLLPRPQAFNSKGQARKERRRKIIISLLQMLSPWVGSRDKEKIFSLESMKVMKTFCVFFQSPPHGRGVQTPSPICSSALPRDNDEKRGSKTRRWRTIFAVQPTPTFYEDTAASRHSRRCLSHPLHGWLR